MSEQASENVDEVATLIYAGEYPEGVKAGYGLHRQSEFCKKDYRERAETFLQTHVLLTKSDHADLVRKAALVDAVTKDSLATSQDAAILRSGLEMMYAALNCVIDARWELFDPAERVMLRNAFERGRAALNGQVWGSNDPPIIR